MIVVDNLTKRYRKKTTVSMKPGAVHRPGFFCFRVCETAELGRGPSCRSLPRTIPRPRAGPQRSVGRKHLFDARPTASRTEECPAGNFGRCPLRCASKSAQRSAPWP
jgi:hypothetical protein